MVTKNSLLLDTCCPAQSNIEADAGTEASQIGTAGTNEIKIANPHRQLDTAQKPFAAYSETVFSHGRSFELDFCGILFADAGLGEYPMATENMATCSLDFVARRSRFPARRVDGSIAA